MKMAIGVSALCGSRGGTQRAAIKLAHEMQDRGHIVEFFCFDTGKETAFPINGGIKVNFTPNGFQWGEHSAIVKVRKILIGENIDVFISMEATWAHMLWQLACMGAGIPFIYSERSDPVYMEAVSWSRAGRWACLSGADFIHELSDVHKKTVPSIWQDKIKVIPNSAPEIRDIDNSSQPPAILALTRFVPAKRVMLLLEAFHLLAPIYGEWNLILRGSGSLEKEIRTYVKKNGLSGRVSITPAGDNLEDNYAGARIYCLPTKVEGFPNSALEAMSFGLPVAGIADCAAMAEIERLGCALLAPEATPPALANTLEKLINSPGMRNCLGENAKKACRGVYAPANVYEQWNSLLHDAFSLKGHTVMDSFELEPFASMATLSAAARREWIYRNFGDSYPYTFKWFMERGISLGRNLYKKLAGSVFHAAAI